MRHVLTTSVLCPRCAEPASRSFVAESRRDRLRFSYSLRCGNCLLAEEGDGAELSDEARSAFISTEGRWEARIRDLGSRRTDAFGVLRRMLHVPPKELTEIARASRPVCEGALVEVERFVDALREVGADVELSRVE